MLRNFNFMLCAVFVITTQIIAQQRWVPFMEETEKSPDINLLQSDNKNVSFTVQVNGMAVEDKNYEGLEYHHLSIPNCDIKMEDGEPDVPVITTLVAVPDCEDVIISIIPSNKLELSNYNVCPTPTYQKQYQQDGNYRIVGVFKEDESIYSVDENFPIKFGEIIETGYIRSQKVIRVALYPIKYNPVTKIITVNTNLEVNLDFKNPTSEIIRNVGLFQRACKGTILNYK